MGSCGALVESRPQRVWVISLAVSLLIPAATSAAAVSAVSLRGNGGGHGALLQRRASRSGDGDAGPFDDSQPACSCDCCDVVRRIPGEIAAGASVKCSPNHQHSEDMCAAQCTTDNEDKVLQDEVVDMQRFCFFECKPADGRNAPDQSQCVAFSAQEASQTIDPAGNPIDPAFLYGPAQQDAPPASFFRNGPPTASNGSPTGSFSNGVYRIPASLLSKTSRASQPDGSKDAGSPDSVDPAAAKKMATQGRSNADQQTKDASAEAARLRDMESKKMDDIHKALKESGDGVLVLDPFAAIQDLNAAAMHARVSAEEAAVIASKAVKAYDGGRKKIWKLALSEAGKEVLRWKAHAEKGAKDLWEAQHKPTWQTVAVKKAQKASKPYIEGLLRNQESVKLYTEKGFALAKSATALWKEAQADAAKANALPRGTIAQANEANSAMLDARDKAKQAQTMALESRQFFATAAETRKGIPVYQYNAQKAAAQAVAMMKPSDVEKEE